MKQALAFELMQNWTPQQLLAVYDFCRLTSDAIWQQHEDSLLHQMVEADRNSGHDLYRSIQSDNLELPLEEINPI